jgi:predicted DsbA family dithiol-disulfide isomerase
MATIEVTEFTDPGCVWSWSSEPKLRRLRGQYGDRVAWRRVFGIQIDDVKLSFPDRDPVDGAEEWRADWLAVAAHSGAPITPRLEWMHSSTWPASRAAKAAEAQGDEVADAVLRRLREAVFVDGRPADNPERIALALAGVPGLDLDWMLEDLESDAVSEAIAKDFDETRDPHPGVIGLKEDGPHPGAAKAEGPIVRYSFPTLIITGPEGERVMPGWRSIEQYEEAFEAVAPELRNSTFTPLSPAEALATYRSLTQEDLRLLTGTTEPPTNAVEVPTSTTPLYLDPVETERRTAIAASY